MSFCSEIDYDILYNPPKSPTFERCVCGKTFKTDWDNETYCSVECARKGTMSALEAGESHHKVLVFEAAARRKVEDDSPASTTAQVTVGTSDAQAQEPQMLVAEEANTDAAQRDSILCIRDADQGAGQEEEDPPPPLPAKKWLRSPVRSLRRMPSSGDLSALARRQSGDHVTPPRRSRRNNK